MEKVVAGKTGVATRAVVAIKIGVAVEADQCVEAEVVEADIAHT